MSHIGSKVVKKYMETLLIVWKLNPKCGEDLKWGYRGNEECSLSPGLVKNKTKSHLSRPVWVWSQLKAGGGTRIDICTLSLMSWGHSNSRNTWTSNCGSNERKTLLSFNWTTRTWEVNTSLILVGFYNWKTPKMCGQPHFTQSMYSSGQF